jgi:hypothetical protein
MKAEIKIIGVNPYVSVPEKLLEKIFKEAGRSRGPIPVCGLINKKPYKQTLVKYSGDWRLYINTIMLKNSPKRIGEIIEISVSFDPTDRTIPPHPAFTKALTKNKEAKEVFDKLSPSRKKEIVRYISALKTEESVAKNIERAISFLSGSGRFVGRDKP